MFTLLLCWIKTQISFGPISWLLIGEIFPLAVRGQAIAIATITNFGSNALVSLFLPGIQESIGVRRLGPGNHSFIGPLHPLFINSHVDTMTFYPTGMSATYFTFAAVGSLAVISIYLTVPETKGRSLEEIEVRRDS